MITSFFVLKDDSFDCTLIAHLRIFLLFYRLLYCLILPENRLFFGIWKVVEIEFESNEEYNEIMFLREITHTINAFNEMADVVRLYSKKPKTAEQRLANLLSEVLYEDSESV